MINESSILESLSNLTEHLSPWWDTLLFGAYLSGFVLILVACTSFSSGNPFQQMKGGQNQGVTKSFSSLIGGLFLLNLPAFLNVCSQSFFEKDSLDMLSYSSHVKATGAIGIYVKFSLTLMMLVGLISIIKGCLLLKDSSETSKGVGQALFHIGGGTVAVNSIYFMQRIGESLSPDFQSQINLIIQ
jgi:hypothetical protein